MNQAMTASPTALTGISDETIYTLQNVTGFTVYFEVASTAPSDATNAFRLESSGEMSVLTFKVSSGESAYIWADRSGGLVVYDEAP